MRFWNISSTPPVGTFPIMSILSSHRLHRKSILFDPLNLERPCWEGISEEAKGFVKVLLDRDPAKRPTAKQALEHPFLRGGSSERSTGGAHAL